MRKLCENVGEFGAGMDAMEARSKASEGGDAVEGTVNGARCARENGKKRLRGDLKVLCRGCGEWRDGGMFSGRQLRKVKQAAKVGKEKKEEGTAMCLACAEKESSYVKVLSKVGEAFVTEESALPIDGMGYFPGFLTEEEEKKIVEVCDRNEWKKVIRRRQQFYGEVYYHTRQDEPEIQPAEHSTMLDMKEFAWLKEKLEASPWKERCFGSMEFPTQILVNEYTEMAGIASHFEDEEAFGPIILTISLLCPIMMTLQKPKEHNNDCMDLDGQTKVLLEPRSLFVMKDDCRYTWRHGISRNAKEIPLPDGSLVKRDSAFRRISLTIRHLLKGRKRIAELAE